MSRKSEVLEYLRSNKDNFSKKFGVVRVGLFGSVAKEIDTKNSDIDIAIEMDKKRKNLRNFFGFKRELEKRFGTKVDVGIETTLKPIVKEVIKEEIIYV